MKDSYTGECARLIADKLRVADPSLDADAFVNDVECELRSDPDVHVRRFASEGMRISLPWARKLTVALEYFQEYREILTQLKSAPEKFVQKSVGNNLNDLMKADPDKARSIISDWCRRRCLRNRTRRQYRLPDERAGKPTAAQPSPSANAE